MQSVSTTKTALRKSPNCASKKQITRRVRRKGKVFQELSKLGLTDFGGCRILPPTRVNETDTCGGKEAEHRYHLFSGARFLYL